MKSKILLVLSLLFINHLTSQNLLSNPGFELGGSGVGFVTNGAGYTAVATPTGSTVPGNFAVIANPYTLNTTDFIFEGDHTTTIGKMLVIDGNTTAGSPRFWKAGSTGAGITTAVVGTIYHFSYWIKSVSNLGSPADVGIQITGGTPPVLVSGSAIAPAPAQSWRQVIYSFTATATTVQIELWNNNISAAGNDFAVDDFMLTDDLIVNANVTNAACATAADGSIVVTGFGGTPPYVTYQLTQTAGGAISLSNATGIFPNLPPGTYTVSVTDSALPTAATATLTNVIVGPKITVTNNTSICAGSSITLHAAGSPSGYTWTASPADPSLTQPNSATPTVTPTVTTVYTATSTVGSCAPISNSVTITVNALPNVTSANQAQTICPGNTATFTITGTPNSTVTITNPSVVPTTTTVSIGPAGTGTFTTPVLNASVVYSLTQIKGFFTLCVRPLSGLTLSITVVPNGCATVKTDPAPNTPPLDLTLCTTGECRTLEANFSNVPSTNSYVVTSIPYCPQASFTDPTYNQVPITFDDAWSSVITLPFNFCFFNTNYTSCQVGTNGLLTFDAVPALSNGACLWNFTGLSVPNTGFPNRNSIYGVYQDAETRTAGGEAPPEVSVNWKLVGTYPCRKLIVNFYHLGQFQCDQSVGNQTSQIVLYEVSNIIEVYVERRQACTSWNTPGGAGVIGIQNDAGTIGYTPPGRNTGAWSANNEAWRFTPTGPNVPVTIDWYEGTVATGTHLGSGPTQVVCPTTTTTYTLQATYQVCGVPQTAVTTTTLNVHPDSTGAPANLTKCAPSCNFDLTSNNAVILGALNPADYDISYHTSQADADTGNNPIATPANYCPNSGAVGVYTIYASIFLNSYNCHVVKPFTLTISNCGVNPNPVNDIVICDDASNDGLAIFNLSPQTPVALGALNPADYTITYHTSLADANGAVAVNPISPITAFHNTTNPQTIWIRMESNINAGQFGVTDFDLIINRFANAGTDGNTSICDGDTTPITLSNIITGEQTGGTWTQTSGTGGTFNAGAGTFTPAAGTTTSTFTYTITGVAPCPNDTSLATVNVVTPPSAGADGGIVICATSSTPIDLYSLITGEQSGGTWVRSTGTGGIFNAAAGTFTPTTGATTSTFTYTVPGTAPCGPDSSVATVTIGSQPNAGTDGSIVICETSPTPINLSSLITGEDPGGVWTRSGGSGGTFNAAAGTFTPAVGATSSTFTYTIAGVAPCITDTSDVTVTIIAQPTAGADGGTVVCETNTTPIDLYSLITGEATGGTWVRTTGTGGTFNAAGGTYTPAVGATSSTFTYTVIGTAPCINDSSIATITINAQPNAGTDGGTVVCETSVAAINLFNLITGEQPGGVWTQTTGSGGTFNAAAGTFTPAVGATTSTFTYTLTGTAPCINDTSLATVTINPQPTAGIDGGTIVCENSVVAVDLFSLITGEATGGTWVRTTGTGGTFNAVAGTYTPAIGATTSTFTYTVTGVAPCIADSSVATITINAMPNAGTDGGTVVCETSIAAINLFNLITGEQAGGTWTRTTGTGGTFNAAAGTFTPAVGAITSTFTYTVSGTAPCPNDTSLATITINPQPNAGVDGATVVCETSTTAVDLYSLITGEQPGGTWVRTTGTGGTFNAAAGTFTPAVGATTSTFTYTLTGVAPCINDSSLATITINPQPTAGTDGGTTICENNPAVINLYTLITGEQAGGTWTRTTGSGGTFNAVAGTFTPALGVTTSTFTYTVTGTAPCINDDSVATITVNPIPTAVISGTTSVCMGAAAPSITWTGSGGTPPYTFYYTRNGTPLQISTANATASSVSDPIPSTAAPIVYTYNLVGVEDSSSTTCSQNQSGTATVTVIAAPVINTPTDYVVCDDSLNNDGIYCAFNFATKDPEVTAVPGITITYHETPTDAHTGANPLASPYCNLNHPGSQIIYVRAIYPGAPLCESTTSFHLIINPIPIPNPVITDYELCDYNNPGDGVEIFNLGTKSTEIANGQSNVTITYYATLSDAQAQTSPLPNLYSNTSNPQQIFINIKNNTTGCNTTGSFNLIVNPLPVAHPAPTLFECSIGSSTSAVFNMTVNEGTVKGGLPGLSITYFHTLADAQVPTNQIITPAAYTGNDGETVIIRLQDDATGCYSTTTQLLRVTQGPVAVTPTPMQYCDPNNDGFGVFDLDSKIPEIAGGVLPAGVSVTFHETQTDQHTGANALVSPYTNITPWSQIVYVRVFYTLTGCANYTQMKLNVNPTPVATQPTDYELCDYNNPGDGVELFNLTTKIPEILGSINPALTTVTFYHTLSDAQAPANGIVGVTNYPNATNPETLYVRVETTATGCYDIVTLNLVVNPLPNATQPNYLAYSLCDTTLPLAHEQFDLGSRINAILLGQTGMNVTFHFSQADAMADANPLPLLYTNVPAFVQTIWIRIENASTGCYVLSTMDIRVEPLPTPIPPTQPYTICDTDQDGLSCDFNLSSLTADIVQSANYTITYYETSTDANTGSNPINPTVPYCNIDPFMQLLYVRAEDNNTHCYSVMPIELDVDPSPVAPVSLNDIIVCDDDSNPQDSDTRVDLTQRTPDVLAQQPLAASNYTVTYYHTLADAQSPTGLPIIPANNYIGSNNETIWVRVENNASGCYNTGSFKLIINTPLLLTTPTPLSMCDDDDNPNDQYHVFNLRLKDAEITQNLSGYTVTYYPSYALAQAGVAGTEIQTPTAYQNENPQHPAVQTLGVVVTSPAPAYCQSITTLDIRVLPIPTPNTNPPALAAKCDDNNPGDGIEVFDLTVNEAYIGNHDPNVTFHYYASQADAIVPQNEIGNPHAAPVGGNVWIRVENNRVDYQGNNCYVLVEQPLRVNPLPVVVQPLDPFPACDDNADGFTVFNLADAQLTTAVLGASQAVTDYTVSYYLTQAGANPLTNTGESALPSSFTNTQANNQTIYIRVTNNATGCVNATGTLDLVVEAYARAVSPALYTQCDQDPSPFDGMVGINLDTLFTTTVLDGQDPTVFLISYYDTDPTLNPNAQALSGSEVQNHVVGPDTIVWAMVENSSNSIVPHCRAVAPIHIKIEPRPDPVIHGANGMSTICVDYSDNTVIRSLELESGIANPGNYSFEWFEGSNPVSIWNGPTYTVDTASPGAAPRDYTVHVTNGFGLGCDYTSAPFTVIQSGPAEVAPGADPGYVVSEAFSDHQSITVNVVGYGTYEYSLDDGPRQSSNVFEDVTLGTRHVIHVWDVTDGVANSCEELLLEYAQTIDYPHYFTPNGDGIHDVWNISGLSDQHDARIYIFDRYGKLLKQIGSSQNGGWDGTYNGHLMPSDDYWFTVDYTEPSTGQQRQFRAHFTLKR